MTRVRADAMISSLTPFPLAYATRSPLCIDAAAVCGALAAPPPELREHVMRNYTDRALPPYWEELMKEVVEPCAD